MDDEVECDPSKFSFFEIPDFTISKNISTNECQDDHYFATRLKELAKIGSSPVDNKVPVSDQDTFDDTEHNIANNKENIGTPVTSTSVSNNSNEIFSDSRFLHGGSKEVMSTFSQIDNRPISDYIVSQSNEADNMAKVFLQNEHERITPQ